MKQDSWIAPELAGRWLAEAGYNVDPQRHHLAYEKPGVRGKINIHAQGVDEWAVLRLLDRGSFIDAERKRRLGAVTRLERAAKALAFKGAMHPDDHEAIERRYMLAKANLLKVLGFEVEWK